MQFKTDTRVTTDRRAKTNSRATTYKLARTIGSNKEARSVLKHKHDQKPKTITNSDKHHKRKDYIQQVFVWPIVAGVTLSPDFS